MARKPIFVLPFFAGFYFDIFGGSADCGNIVNSALPPRSWIEIDFSRLESNVRNIKATLPAGVKYICVVKADAYGHCMPHALVRFLKGGADIFAVANLYEASRVREIVPDKPVLILSPVLAEERPLVFDYGATAAVSSYEEAAAFDELAKARGKVLGLHIALDTGMGRAGIWHERAVSEIRRILGLKNIKITGIFSPLSDAHSAGKCAVYRVIQPTDLAAAAVPMRIVVVM